MNRSPYGACPSFPVPFCGHKMPQPCLPPSNYPLAQPLLSVISMYPALLQPGAALAFPPLPAQLLGLRGSQACPVPGGKLILGFWKALSILPPALTTGLLLLRCSLPSRWSDTDWMETSPSVTPLGSKVIRHRQGTHSVNGETAHCPLAPHQQNSPNFPRK